MFTLKLILRDNNILISFLKINIIGLSTLFFTGCIGNKIDVLAYPTQIKSKVNIPKICLPVYNSVIPTVAVVEFTNNSTYGKASSVATNSSAKVWQKSRAIGVSPHPSVIASIGRTNSTIQAKSTSVSRQIDSKLSQSIVGPLENLIVNSGGAKLFTRADMDKEEFQIQLMIKL